MPVKINCVVIGGTNDGEVVDFARWSRETGHVVRFIEYMPLDAQHAWSAPRSCPRHASSRRCTRPSRSSLGADHEPSTSYRFADGAPGGLGVISSVTEPFCDTCNRLRLTAEGELRACLFALEDGPARTAPRRRHRRGARGADPRQRPPEVVGAPDQPSGLRAARTEHVGDRRLNARPAPSPSAQTPASFASPSIRLRANRRPSRLDDPAALQVRRDPGDVPRGYRRTKAGQVRVRHHRRDHHPVGGGREARGHELQEAFRDTPLRSR